MESIVIIGGGAAGFFAAINIKEHSPNTNVTIIEQQKAVLQKVKISGGGRCNVTHACFDVRDLVTYYPRGGKALLGMFSRFQPADTFDWFESKGISLKTESDGRVFPKSNTSETIINCFISEAKRHGITILNNRRVSDIQPSTTGFTLSIDENEKLNANRLILATGSSRFGYKMAEKLGHKIVPPVPSLFTFTIKDSKLRDLSGLSITPTQASIVGSKVPAQTGPLLVTHWGLSGPAIIKLSAWGAIELAAKDYSFQVELNLVPDLDMSDLISKIDIAKTSLQNKKITTKSIFSTIPQRLWAYLCDKAKLSDLSWKQFSAPDQARLVETLTTLRLDVNGKSNFKDEFVTAGGIDLNEVDTKTMESKHHKHLYFAGELLNIDGVTGGFNFQNAWTTGYLIAEHIRTT